MDGDNGVGLIEVQVEGGSLGEVQVVDGGD